MSEENITLSVSELEEPPAQSAREYECEVCGIDFFKRYLAPRAMKKNLEKHYLSANHKHNVQRQRLGLPPERLYNFSSANNKLTELIQRLEERISELSQVPLPGSVIMLPEEEEEQPSKPVVKDLIKERLIEDMRPKPVFKIGINERTLLYDYDGHDYTHMRNVSALLTRLLYWIREHMQGDRAKMNADYVDTTFVGIQTQMVHRINGYKNNTEDVEDLAQRLINIADHDWTGD